MAREIRPFNFGDGAREGDLDLRPKFTPQDLVGADEPPEEPAEAPSLIALRLADPSEGTKAPATTKPAAKTARKTAKS